jgi:hypothetical protein
MSFKLTNPPVDDRSRELWLQHAAGFIIFEDMRNYAIKEIPATADKETREMIIKGIDDAVYGLMMIMDGVVGVLKNDEYTVSIESNILLEKNDEIIEKVNTLNGDGMCMGFHGWKDGDFGEDQVYTIVP